MELNKLGKLKGNSTQSKRKGRGIGSGKGGHTVGFGMKGQKSRSGNSIPYGFEGGQVPIFKKLPQIGGFKNPTKKHITAITISRLNAFDDKSVVTPKEVVEKGIVKKMPKHGIKLLLGGEMEKKITVRGFLISEGAKIKLEKSGCVVEN
jgi:large subunit ribosomal protein L15